jgi:thioredoxin reductase (NADPH)
MEEQAKKFGTHFENAEVQEIMKDSNLNVFIIKAPGVEFKAKSVIIATGTSPKRLGVKGESTYIGRGLSTCATCDGPLYRDKTVAVVGGGDSALDEGLFLTRFAKKVYVIHRRNEFRAVKILQKRARENPKMEFLCERVVEEIIGDEKIRRVRLKNVKTGEESELEVDGLFLYIGLIPNTRMVNVKKDESGYIITDDAMQTSVKGIFAAGDCRKTHLRQVSTAIGDGAIAAHFAEKYVEELSIKDGKSFDGIPCSLK